MRYKILTLALIAGLIQSCANDKQQEETTTPPETVAGPVDQQWQDQNDMQSANSMNDRNAYMTTDERTAAVAATTNKPAAKTDKPVVVKNRPVVGRVNNNRTINRQPVAQPEPKRDVVYVMANSSSNNSNIKAVYEVPRNVYMKQRAAIAKSNTPFTPPGDKNAAHTDQPGDDYRGKDVMTHDGVAKNKERNMNYLNFSTAKPANDGGDFDK